MIGKQRKLLPRFITLRILGLIFAFILSIKLLSACSHQQDQPKPLVTLSFVVTQRESQYWRPLLKQFNDNNRDILIEIANAAENNLENPDKSDDLKEIYISEFNKQQPKYDLIYMDIIWVPEFADKKLLMDLTEYFPEKELKGFITSEVDAGRFKNKLYRIPFRSDVGVLFYRKDWLDELKIELPEKLTFDHLMEISELVKQKKKDIPYGYLWQGKPSEAMTAMFVEVLDSYGGFWINGNEVGLDKLEAIKAIKFLRDTIKKDISPKNFINNEERTTHSMFTNNEAVFLRNWPDVWRDINGSESDFPSNIAIKPVVHPQKKESYASCKGGWGFGIAEKSPHKKEALKAIKFLTSAASQQKFTLAYASVPSRENLFYDPKIVAKYSYYPDLLKIVENSVSRPAIPKYTKASEILRKHLSEALKIENDDYTKEMEKAAQETRELFKNPTT
ncbi:hypothetical protein BV375_03400 [Nostoc sp. 106C]|nr:hypothetical protein BV375_03400 [Nostoc sp. 106C]